MHCYRKNSIVSDVAKQNKKKTITLIKCNKQSWNRKCLFVVTNRNQNNLLNYTLSKHRF